MDCGEVSSDHDRHTKTAGYPKPLRANGAVLQAEAKVRACEETQAPSRKGSKRGDAVRDMFITFRGEADVYIQYRVDASGPGSGVGVDWWFPDLPIRKVLSLTPVEEEEITAAVIAHWDDENR